MTFDVADMYRSLRGRLFLTDPKTLGLSSDGEERFWGMMVDIGIENGVATLVVLRDGSISLYLSNGGGVIGLGQHDALHEKAAKILELAESFSLEGPEAERDTLPSEGFTRFNFLGYNGVRAVEEDDQELEDGAHALSPLYNAAHDLLAAAEDMEEKRAGGAR
jgi:hypothetical protein